PLLSIICQTRPPPSPTLFPYTTLFRSSTYNLEAPLAAGARRHTVIPPPVDLGRLAPRPSAPALPPVVLFVGRIAPNKRQEELIRDRKSTRLNSSHLVISYAVFCLKKKK